MELKLAKARIKGGRAIKKGGGKHYKNNLLKGYNNLYPHLYPYLGWRGYYTERRIKHRKK